MKTTQQTNQKPIIIAKKRLVAKTICPNCKRPTKVFVKKIIGDCRDCGKEIDGDVIIEDDALGFYAWPILLQCETHDEIMLQATDNNLAGAERLISIFSNLGLEVEKREQVSYRNRKSNTDMLVWQITLKKISAISK